MATIQDLIKERTVSQDVSDANFLLKKLRRDMVLAQQEDKERAENIKKGGKTGLNTIKTRREFLLAKRFKPDLTFGEFLLDPKTAGQYMLEGSKKIASGESAPLTLRETFGIPRRIDDSGMVNVREGFGKTTPSFGTRNAYDSFALGAPNPERMQSDAMLEGLRSGARRSVPSAQQDILPDVEVESIIPPPMGDVSNQGLQNMLNRGRVPIVPQVEYASPSMAREITRQQPIQMAQVDVMSRPKPNIDALRRVQESGVENLGIEQVGVTDPLQDAAQKSSALGTAGNVLGTVGSVASLGSGLSDIARGRGDLSAVSRAGAGAAGLASAAGLVNPLLGAGLGLLSLISKRRR
jgi:hypothetical protein